MKKTIKKKTEKFNPLMDLNCTTVRACYSLAPCTSTDIHISLFSVSMLISILKIHRKEKL